MEKGLHSKSVPVLLWGCMNRAGAEEDRNTAYLESDHDKVTGSEDERLQALCQRADMT